MLKIKNLKVQAENIEILKGLDLNINQGKIHVLMGQNGSGKSTLAQTLMGNPAFEVKDGQVLFNNQNLLDLSPDRRSLAGLFLSFQYPSEVTGVTSSSFLRMIYNKRQAKPLTPIKFKRILHEKMDLVEMDRDFANRYLNEGFSGGEKKRMEMLQMLIAQPRLAILDEIDSGLDIDALKIVACAVNYLHKLGTTILLITHYSRILSHIKPDHVHVMKDGIIVRQGGEELAYELEEKGYQMI